MIFQNSRLMDFMRSILIGVTVSVISTGCGNGSAGASGDRVAWQVTDPLWIGAVEGDGPDVFGSIAALAVDEEGRIYVFDGRAYELRVFDHEGSFVSRFGRQGQGPGEFEHVIGMSSAPDGSLWIVDGPNARYTVLRGDEVGTYARGAGIYNVPWVGGHADGYLHDVVLVPGQPSREALVRVSPAGVAVDTFEVPANDVETPRFGSTRLPLPFAPRQIRAFDPRGALWVALSHEYTLYRIGLRGDTLQAVRRDSEPRPISTAEADSVTRYIRTLRDAFGIDVRAGLMPRTAPLLTRNTIANDGSVWVTRADPPTGSPGGTRFDVFDPDGQLIGEVVVDFPLTLWLVQNDQIYGVALDELGVERVYRARVEPAA